MTRDESAEAQRAIDAAGDDLYDAQGAAGLVGLWLHGASASASTRLETGYRQAAAESLDAAIAETEAALVKLRRARTLVGPAAVEG